MSDMLNAIERLAVLTWERGRTYPIEWSRAAPEFFGMSRLALWLRDDEAYAAAYFLSEIADQYAMEARRHAA